MASPMEMDTDSQDTSGAVAAAPAESSSIAGKLADTLKLEYQFLRVPFEHYKKTLRANHRALEKGLSAVISEVSSVADSDLSEADAVQKLNSLSQRLQGIKRKLDEGCETEQVQTQKCRTRLAHLGSAENMPEWDSIRLKRILVDYMLRMSYFDTAAMLAKKSNIENLVDLDVFHEARKVIDALKRKEVAPALAWCAENKSRLKKSKSKFEFAVRLQEFIELVREDKFMQAVTYARRYLAPWAASYMKDFQCAFATLAFRSNTECARYKDLFKETQWDSLIEKFKKEFYGLYGMTLQPLLNIYLQAGLCALKTPASYEDDCTKEDPLSQEDFRILALPLPYSKQLHSKLICYISREIMNHDNLPLALPNGYVYSTKALKEMANQNNSKITCPRTGLVCHFSELKKVFIS